ncbi:hypothetical protein BD779DRAFT_1549388 [Infundibulicybe gibba]|nr:hypothetical protein BD779DRAFT_1549388 [Infundibulicybe gibba]
MPRHHPRVYLPPTMHHRAPALHRRPCSRQDHGALSPSNHPTISSYTPSWVF